MESSSCESSRFSVLIIQPRYFEAYPRFDSSEAVNRCQIVGQIEGGDELADDIKRPYAQRMAPRSFPQFGSEPKAAGSFCEFHLNNSRSSAVARAAESPGPSPGNSRRIGSSSMSQLPLVHLAGNTWPDVGVLSMRFRSSKNNTVSPRATTPPPSIGTLLSVLGVLAIPRFTQRRAWGS